MRNRITRLLYIVSVLIIYTSYKAIQLWPTQPLAGITLSILLFVVILGGTFGYRARPQIFDKFWFHVLTWTGSIAMGLWATFMIISIPVDVLHLLIFAFQKAFAVEPEKLSSLFRDIYIFIFVLTLGLSGLGYLEVLRGPRIKKTLLTIADLDPALEGLKIAQLSDLHVGTTIRKGYVEEVVARTNAAHPDLIVLTGDIADAQASSVVEHLKPLQGLKSRFGVFYVTGNHEYYWEPKALISQMRSLGFQVLLNSNIVLKVGAAQLMVAGVTDHAGEQMLPGHKPDARAALSSSEKVSFKILLAHRPDACVAAEPLGAELQFSGHTHAGQFFPFSLFIGLAHQYSRGLYRHGQMWVYVNPGTGYWGPANRLGVGAEISLITLAREPV